MGPFEVTPELEAFRQEVRRTAERAFKDKAAYWDEREEFPAENKDKLAELGYFGLLIPEQYGGLGAPLIQGAICVEELARVDLNTALVCQLYLHGPAGHIAAIGTEQQKRRFLPKLARGEIFFGISISEPHAGSAVTDLKTIATLEGDQVVLNGSKCFTTAGHVISHVLVFVRFGRSQGAKGIGAVIVERGTPGFESGKPAPKMGTRGIGEAELFFDNCRVPKENIFVLGDPENSEGFKKLMSCFGTERVGSAAMSVGIAQGALDFAKAHSEQRQQFGRPIMEFQGIQWKIADMATQLQAARLMAYRAACNVNASGCPDPFETAMAKLFANEMVQRVTNEAMQICGHYGYTRLAPLERMSRDARNFAYAAGTLEILRNTIAAMAYGRGFDRRKG